jgi:putative ABC transport system substrate-binding protein
LPQMASELVQRRVEVIAALGTSAPGHAAKMATATIPIVFQTGGDPVEERLVPNMNHPGGNISGVTRLNVATDGKRLGLLREALPSARLIGCLTNVDARSASQSAHIEEAARSLGLEVHFSTVATQTEVEAAFATMRRLGVDALLIATGPAETGIREQISELTVRQHLPAIAPNRIFMLNGVLMSYDANLADSYRQAGTYVARILDGAKPADLPVLQSTTFDLSINLKAANALGLAIPPSLLARADEVIE